jgi:hypothetical protein
VTWKRLQTQRRIKTHRTSKAELAELRAAVEVKLRDAASTAISSDTRFTTAYGAALLVAKIAIAVAGYRLDPKAGGHHKTAFECLPLALGSAARPLARYFEVCRRKRNEIDYDRAFVASDADAEEIIRRTRELQASAEAWIAEHHVGFAK